MVKKAPFVVLLLSFVASSCSIPQDGMGSENIHTEPSTEQIQTIPADMLISTQLVQASNVIPCSTLEPQQMILGTPISSGSAEEMVTMTLAPTKAEQDIVDPYQVYYAIGAEWQQTIERVGGYKVDRLIKWIPEVDDSFLKSLLRFKSMPCSHDPDQVGLPACLTTEEEGTRVQVFPISALDLMFLRRKEIDEWLDYEVDHFYAAYFDFRESDEPEYWWQVYYVLMFLLKDSRILLARVTEDFIIRMDFIEPPYEPSSESIPYTLAMTFPSQSYIQSALRDELVSSQFAMVEGRLCFPSEAIPNMTVYFEELSTGEQIPIETGSNQVYYSIRLAPGTYRAYAWSGGYGAIYSEYVVCDLGTTCDSHEFAEFEVLPGMISYGIDICDWNAPQEDIPRPPGE